MNPHSIEVWSSVPRDENQTVYRHPRNLTTTPRPPPPPTQSRTTVRRQGQRQRRPVRRRATRVPPRTERQGRGARREARVRARLPSPIQELVRQETLPLPGPTARVPDHPAALTNRARRADRGVRGY